MKSVKSNPSGGKIIMRRLGDPQLPRDAVKMSQVVRWKSGKAEIHYIYSKTMDIYFDFKFK